MIFALILNCYFSFFCYNHFMIYFFAVLTVLATILGGLFAFRFRDRLNWLMAFAAGALISLAIFEVMPEVFSLSGELNIAISVVMIAVSIGFFSFYILEKYMVVHACQEGECESEHHENVGVLGGIGLTFHSLIDGLAIGASFAVSETFGILISTAVILHKFSDGLCTVTLLLSHKNEQRQAWIYLLLVSLIPIIGIIFPHYIHIPENYLLYILSYFAGFFLYIGASDLLPEAHEKNQSKYLALATLSGALLVFALTRIV